MTSKRALLGKVRSLRGSRTIQSRTDNSDEGCVHVPCSESDAPMAWPARNFPLGAEPSREWDSPLLGRRPAKRRAGQLHSVASWRWHGVAAAWSLCSDKPLFGSRQRPRQACWEIFTHTRQGLAVASRATAKSIASQAVQGQ